MLLLHKNPLVYREVRSRVRPAKLLALCVAVGGFLILALTYITLNVAERHDRIVFIDWQRVWRQFATTVMALQVFCGFYVALGVSANSIAREKIGRTYDFLTTLPISSPDKALALALGPNLYSLVILVVLIPVALLAGTAGGYPLENLLWFFGMMGAFFLTAGMLGAALGSGLSGSMLGWLLVLVIFAFDMSMTGVVSERHFAVTPLLSLAPFATMRVLLEAPDYLTTVFAPGQHHLFTETVPWQISPLSFLAFLWVLSFALAGTKLSRPSNPPLDRPVVLVAFAILQVLLLGFLADALMDSGEPATVVAVFLVLNYAFLAFWAIVAQPAYAALMAWVRRRRNWPLRMISQSLTTVHSPNLLALALLWIVAVAFLWAVDWYYWGCYIPLERIAGIGAILLVFLLAYQCLYTAGCAASRRNGKALGFILVAMAVAIPAIFATLENYEDLLSATPIALFAKAPDLLRPYEPWGAYREVQLSLVLSCVQLVLYGALCLLALAGLARKRARQSVHT